MAERALAPLLEGGAFFECPRRRDGRSREAVLFETTVDVPHAGLP